ncbi:MAG: hypothetical protein M3273_00500 [Actinomycetota bacterium]|nr:hypothetical protein [Actinomycetota bacterium]
MVTSHPRRMLGLVAIALAAGCTGEDAAPAGLVEEPVAPSAAPAKTNDERGRATCRDGEGDLLSEGGGDRTGPPARAPRHPRPGADLTAMSMERGAGGMTVNFATHSRIPQALPARARLSYLVTTSSAAGGEVAAVSATFRKGRWIAEIREGERYTIVRGTPDIAGKVLQINVEPADVPTLMRGAFRWRVFSEWVPGSPSETSKTYLDYCPDSGFPVLRGRST